MQQRKLSQYFSLAEMTKSSATARFGLNNTPPPQVVAALERLCVEVLDPLRVLVGRPIVVNSGYRSPEVNKYIGGAARSQHCLGEAADIECPGVSNLALALQIERSALPFDQLILEFHDVGDDASGWVHVSHVAVPASPPAGAARPLSPLALIDAATEKRAENKAKDRNCRQVLTAVRVDGVTQYRPGLPRIELPARK